MDRIKEKLQALKMEADAADDRAAEAEAKNKKLVQELLEKDQTISSLEYRNQTLQAEVDKLEERLTNTKAEATEGATSKAAASNLERKLQLLEEELDNSEKSLKETIEKSRQLDMKAEHYERQVTRLEKERDKWEAKYEEENAKYNQSKKELDELVLSMGDI